ncbi:MAG TPA: hypothetical protein VFB82_18895 [Blastocatellia bacterium]|nr:hypothetical protein [Blastocatellia bacterium]
MAKSKSKSAKSAVFTAASAQLLSDLKGAKDKMSAAFLQAAPATAFSAKSMATTTAPETNVVGVGIGEKISDGKNTGVMAVKFLVRVKYSPSEVDKKHQLPRTVNGLPTDVEQVGTFRKLGAPAPVLPPMPNPKLRFRPAQPGCSVGFRDPGNAFIMAGTFGALVKSSQGLFVLSNNHVLADENQLPLGSPIFQPGLLDGGKPLTDRIATLTKFIKLKSTGMNKVDAAIAKALKASLVSNEILFIGKPKGVTPALMDMVVHKFGRTTSYRVGRVTSVNTDVSVQYDTGLYKFSGQIIIKGLNNQPFSAGGDSGSLILERATNKAVGLLFAGSTSHTIANHIKDVLTAFGVTLA